MINLRNAFRFIIKTPFQNLIVLLAVIVSIGVQFFILSLGSVLDYMILDQTTSYQDHIILNNYIKQKTNYNDLDFNLLKDIKNNDSNIKYIHYFLLIDGDIVEINDKPVTPSIRLNLHGYDNENNEDTYLSYTGLNEKKHLLGNSKVADTSKNEIMLDVTFAKANNLEIGQTITYKQNNTNDLYYFKIVGIYDLGIFRKQNNYTFIDLEKFNNLSSNNYSINIQLNNTNNTSNSLKKVLSFLDDDKINSISWEEVIPEVSVLNKAQKIVILVIEIFISIAFFVVILSVLNYSVKKKYPQFGILKAIGQKNKDIRNTLTLQTTIIASLGALIGLSLGTIAIKTYEGLMTYPDGTKRFLVELGLNNYLIPGLLTLLSTLIASFASYLKVKKLSIIELIKE